MGDLISRSALLEKVRDRIFDKDGIKDDLDRQYHRGLLHAIKDVKLAPAVDAEPVRYGQWNNGRCTGCGEHAPYWCMATTYHRSSYCPNCGARMDGDAESCASQN